MQYINNTLFFESLFTVTLAILVLFIGKGLTLRFSILERLNIPGAIVGGLVFAVLFAIIHLSSNLVIEFDLTARDAMIVYFFTTIGLSSNIKDLKKGGKYLLYLLIVTFIYMLLQDTIGISMASIFGLEPIVGLLSGTVSLIGGHGTTIAWASIFEDKYSVENAMEIGIAVATIGLILASITGGPIANYLIKKHDLVPIDKDILTDKERKIKQEHTPIDSMSFLHAVGAINVSIMVGYFINETISLAGLNLPNFVTALFAGILLNSFVTPKLKKRYTWVEWEARASAMTLIADISLGIFLAMSLMSMQLWVLANLATPVLLIIVVQFVVTIIITIYIIFRLMGGTYDAAVIAAGFSGYALGSTAIAMANMKAVTKKYGASTLAFLVVPMACAFFIDLFNVVIIQTVLSFF